MDQRRRIFGLRAGIRHNGGDGLALPGRAVRCQRMLRCRFQAGEMRQHANPRRANSRQVRGRHNAHNAGHGAGGIGIDVPDTRMGIGATDERHVDHARQALIAGVLALTAQQAPGVGARDAAADVAVGQVGWHKNVQAAAPIRSCTTLSIASTMAW